MTPPSPTSSQMSFLLSHENDCLYHLAINPIPLGEEHNASLFYPSTCLDSLTQLQLLPRRVHFSPQLRSPLQTRRLNPHIGGGEGGTRLAVTCISVGLLQKVSAGVHVCKRADAQAVGGMQLRLQEVTAVLPNVHELQQAGRWEQHLQEKVTC